MVSAATRKIISRLSKIQIMIVDNDEKVIAMMTNVLKNIGFSNIFGARDGFEAVKVLKAQKFDLIITDWELRPQGALGEAAKATGNGEGSFALPVDGAGFIKFVRTSRHSPNPYVSVIMLVGQASKENIEKARDSGVNEVVVKPVSAESLCERIAMAIDRHGVFVTSSNYRGPCRRRRQIPIPAHMERRKQDIRVIPHTQ